MARSVRQPPTNISKTRWASIIDREIAVKAYLNIWVVGGLLWFFYCNFAAANNAGAQTLDEVLVEAHRNDAESTSTLSVTPLFELPLSATTLSIEIFSDRIPKDIADLAEYSPGVSRRSNYWGVDTPTFQLRGFNAGESTAYYKDGFRYQARGPLSMANVESIEILRGPQSAIYGWSEPGGAVQVRVKQPTTQKIRKASLQTNVWGMSSANLDLAGAMSNSSRFRFVAAHEQAGSFRDQQRGDQTLLSPAFAFDFADGQQLNISFEWLDDQRSTDYGVPAINGAPADVPVSRIYTEAWGQQHSQSSRLTTRWLQPTMGGDLALALSYYDFKYLSYQDVEPYSVTGTSINRWYESYPEQYKWLTGYADWSRAFQAGSFHHHVVSRLEAAREARSLKSGVLDDYLSIDAYNPIYSQLWTPTANYSVYDQAWTNHSFALAVQDEVVIDNWTCLFGVRFSYLRQIFDYADYLPLPSLDHSIQTDRSITPRLGVNWRVTPSLALYANYSAGNMATLPQSRSFTGNTFMPMASKQIEAGLKIHPEQEDWSASAALFDIERSNVLTRDLNHAGFSIQTGVQRSRGIEIEWQGEFAKNWRITTQSTWLDAFIVQDNRYALGNQLPYTPRFGASAWISHRFLSDGVKHWSTSGGIVHQGERYADFANTTRIPPFTRLDLGVSYKEKVWSATLSLENATNLRYFSSGVENRPAVIYPGAPRTLSLKLAYDFL